jgi:hypothetical protein
MSRSSHRSVAVVRHRFAPLALTALAVASAVACGDSPATAPSPPSTAGTSGTILDPCTVPDANARPGPAGGPAIVEGGSLPPGTGSAGPPGTGGVSEACRDSGGAVEGGAGGGGTEQRPSRGGLGDTGSGGSSSGPSGSVAGSGPVSSLESDRPPPGY